jgi:aldehyde:ferredoxin oxidoreductase
MTDTITGFMISGLTDMELARKLLESGHAENVRDYLVAAIGPGQFAVRLQAEQQGAGDALAEAAQFAAEVLSELYAKYSVKIGPFASQAQMANVRLGAALRALAARQPVGEPAFFVTKGLPEICKQIGDHPHHNITATTRPTKLHTVPLYTAPPAVVDLGQFNALALLASAVVRHRDESPMKNGVFAEAERLLALIDSKAVRNG